MTESTRPSEYDAGSREEAVEAGLTAESFEAAHGHGDEHHVTAVDVAGVHPHKHHPFDPNTGVVRMRVERPAMIAGVLAALVMLGGLIALGIAVGRA